MKVFFFTLLWCSAAIAQDFALQVSKFNLKYTDPMGEGQAASFSFNEYSAQDVKVQLEKAGSSFHVVATGNEHFEEFEVEDAPEFLLKARTMSVSNLNLTFAEKIQLGLTQGKFDSADSLKVDNLSLDCSRAKKEVDLGDQAIAGCLQKLSFKISKLSSSSDTKEFSVLNLGVQSMDLRINAGKFDLSADVKAQVSGRVKGNGSASYDSQKGLLTIKISEVKFGFFNITSKVFDELKREENERMRVREPYVYLQLK
jgi:hypothetical protein